MSEANDVAKLRKECPQDYIVIFYEYWLQFCEHNCPLLITSLPWVKYGFRFGIFLCLWGNISIIWVKQIQKNIKDHLFFSSSSSSSSRCLFYLMIHNTYINNICKRAYFYYGFLLIFPIIGVLKIKVKLISVCYFHLLEDWPYFG